MLCLKLVNITSLTFCNLFHAQQTYRLRPRVLRDVSKPISTRVQLLGEWVESPIGVSPTAIHKFAHSDGEAATAKGTGIKMH